MIKGPGNARRTIGAHTISFVTIHRAPAQLAQNATTQDRATIVQQAWHRFFQDPSMWRDNRSTKTDRNYPDFVHATTREALWINSSFCPKWVQSELDSLETCRFSPSLDVKMRYRKIARSSFQIGSVFDSVGNADDKALPQRNQYFTTKLISELTKRGQGREGLRIYKIMREEGVTPKAQTLIAALKACRSVADLETGKELHTHVIESGHQTNIFVANTLLDMYAKCGSMVDARRVFDSMLHRDVASWTAMIMAYAQRDEGESAMHLYARMQHEGFRPNARTFVAALKACGSLAIREEARQVNGGFLKLRSLEKGRIIFSQAATSGFQTDMFVANTLIDMYAKCGSMVDALQVFEKMPQPDVVSWNAMIMGYAQMDRGDLALQLYERMQHESFTPDARTFVAALKACSSLAAQEEGKVVDGIIMKLGCLKKGRAIHSQVAQGVFEADIFVANTLVDMYAKCGSMVDASQVFEKMPRRDLVSWTAMIMGYAQIENGELALQLYAHMQHEGFRPDARTFVAALKACSSLAVQEGKHVDGLVKTVCLETGRTIHSQVAKGGFESDLFVASSLVCMYVKCGSMVDARRVFKKMPHRDLVMWNAMIMGYAQKEEGELALQLYARMQYEGCTPDALTFVAALKACGSLASLETGKEIHAEICRVGLAGDDLVATCLIVMYGKCGSMVDAQRLFDSLPVRDVVKWSALIAGYSDHGDTERVFNLFERMQQEAIQPDSVAFISILTVCSHAGLVDKGEMYFQSMCFDHGLIPSNEHYRCMVDLLGRAGHLDEAMAMVKKMPFKLDVLTWMTILGACRKWNNVEVGSCAFKCAVMLDEKQAAAYVLMANIYASSQMWEESVKIQELRMNARAWKKPGQCWWADNDGTVDAFLVGDGIEAIPKAETSFCRNGLGSICN